MVSVDTPRRYARILIVNADDFGRTEGINEGVAAAHELGIVTSASLMVRWPDAEWAAAYARRYPDLSVGLHIDLGEWHHRAGHWTPAYEVVAQQDREAVIAEIDHQLALFKTLVGRYPTHMDSHQHVHRKEPVRSALMGVAQELGVCLRNVGRSPKYCGEFYGRTKVGESLSEAVSVDKLIRLLRGLGPGATELACHPATSADHDPMYGSERRAELEALCDPRVREAIEKQQIELASFNKLPLSMSV